MFYLKVHDVPGEVLVAVCDKATLGKTFSSGKLQMQVNERFYKGALASEDEALEALERATIANLVGNLIVEKAVEHSLVSAESVIEIGGVKHAQMVCIPKPKKK